MTIKTSIHIIAIILNTKIVFNSFLMQKSHKCLWIAVNHYHYVTIKFVVFWPDVFYGLLSWPECLNIIARILVLSDDWQVCSGLADRNKEFHLRKTHFITYQIYHDLFDTLAARKKHQELVHCYNVVLLGFNVINRQGF